MKKLSVVVPMYYEEEVAKECDTINYEILCNISKRIPRKYV